MQTKERNERWLGMSAAQLVMECQDLCQQRDELQQMSECAAIQIGNLENRIYRLTAKLAAKGAEK